MRNGSGILHELTTTSVHVSDLDNHLRAMRSANAQLRDRIVALRSQLAGAVAAHEWRAELERSLGARVLAVECELEHARAEAEDLMAAIDAAADEEVHAIVESGRAQALQLQRALDALVGEPADVVPLTRRPAAAPGDDSPSVGERSVAI